MLVGRDTERQRVERLVAAARSGSSGTLVVAGEAGIGKSALLAEARSLAGDMQVVAASGAEAEQDLPFAGLSQLVRPLLGLLDRIPGPQADALAQALALRPGPPGERFAVAAAVLSLVSRAAEDRPLLVLVDDLQHMDRPSVDAVLFVARRLLTDAVAVLVGLRTGTEVDELVTGLDQLALTGLDVAQSGVLAGEGRLSAAQLVRLHEVTGGNPLAVLEMSGSPHLLEQDADGIAVPRLIARAFAAQVGRLTPPARTALLVAAAAGDVDIGTVARACVALDTHVDALAEAERARMVAVAGDRVTFRHPLLRAAVLQDADPALRRAAHRAVVAALPTGDLDRRAGHLAEATVLPDADVAELLELAAGSARQRRAHAVAAQRFERAARLSVTDSDRARRLTDAGEAAWLGGITDQARELLGEAERSAPDEASRIRAVALQGVVTARCGSLVAARRMLLEAASARAESDPDEATMLLADAMYTCFYLGDATGTRTVVGGLDALDPRPRSDQARLLGDLAAGMGRILLGDGVAGAALLHRAVSAADHLSDDPRWLGWLLLGPIWLRETGSARAVVDHVVARARELSALGTLPFLLFHAARDDATTDRWTAAEASYREAIGLARETGQRTDEGISLVFLTCLLARQGRERETRETAVEALAVCRRSELGIGMVWLDYALGDSESGAGNTAAALAHYRAVGQTVARLGMADPDILPGAELVECLVRQGRHDEALAEAHAYADRAAVKGQPWALARAHRALAVAGAEPEAAFARALAGHADSPDAYERARTELAFGTWLRRERRRTEARTHLRAALDTFDGLGARPWAEAAASELAATGERVRRRAAAPAALTPQEYQVARLLAEGMTTREAAAALFLSPKTVEYHLRHVYLELGISSRRELAERYAADPQLQR